VVSISGTLMTVFGYFSISNLKQSADDSKDAYERTKAQVDETYASVICLVSEAESSNNIGCALAKSGDPKQASSG
jgi:hypothetical protein